MAGLSVARGVFNESLPLKDGAFFLDKENNILYIKNDTGWTKVYSDSPVFKQVIAQKENEQTNLQATGLTIQKKVDDVWTDIGVVTSINGDFFIANSEVKLNVALPTDSVTYHLTSDTLDNNATNSKNIIFTGEIIDDVTHISEKAFNGSIEIPAESLTGDIALYTKATGLDIQGTSVTKDGTTSMAVSSYNELASTDWGLTEEQIASNIFKEV